MQEKVIANCLVKAKFLHKISENSFNVNEKSLFL
jgi:hypothetical protein